MTAPALHTNCRNKAASLLPDLNRTFPDNVQFRRASSPCLQKALDNVLLAYGHHNPAVGYCQVTVPTECV